jgi:mRNA-degrading endonuclease RelE of RelBE toxin-antitoxin system
MAKRRPPKAATVPPPSAGASVVVQIGWAPNAREAFDRLPAKAQAGIRRKLEDFGAAGAGKPLVRGLKGFQRVTYGRLRCIATRADGPIILVYVLEVGLRKAGSDDDAYELARRALDSGDPEIVEALNELATGFLSGDVKLDE